MTRKSHHPRFEIGKLLCGDSGFSLMEIVIAAGLALFVALGAASIQHFSTKGNKLAASQTANTGLAAAIRNQLSRKDSCLLSLVQQPSSFSATSEIAVRLGGAESDVVQAGANLTDWKVLITSLQFTNITSAGKANGNNAYIGDVILNSQSAELDPGKRVTFRPMPVAHVTFETNASGIVACYAADTFSDTTQQLQSVCEMFMNSNGQAASWDFVNQKCTLPAPSAGAVCSSMNDVWNGSHCVAPGQRLCSNLNEQWNGYCQPNVQIVGGTTPPMTPWNGGIGGSVACPPGKKIIGGTCLSSSGNAPLNTIFDVNPPQAIGCGWDSTQTGNAFDYQAACL